MSHQKPAVVLKWKNKKISFYFLSTIKKVLQNLQNSSLRGDSVTSYQKVRDKLASTNLGFQYTLESA